ncbi:NAD(P)-dependent dehydrogenase (short-subunit alcohol dehydrogenase family) [Curtobacterium sp. PhB130]|uniref:SDR family NAD(P)-dependent oxidoreductase n=1 Tax=Curtobacterium sp. PhB130 TaxID=2485178 RepID=UPI000F4C85D0|nr:oxidoreductase [Curtobacterium sp. PhB130]ROS73935.1 NAD(P)-dependent dehydrogenase (short-subunit alcohol dehydrogenase family) [Curtobacterium sp. PhB130]
MDLHLTGKVAVVTGASKGIGLAITEALVAEGARVVAGARSITDELVALSDSGQVLAVPVDLSTPDGPAGLVARAAHFGGLDVLVNNVGAVTPRTDGFLAVSDEDWSRTLNLSLLAPVRTTRAAIPLLLERGGGNVVTIASVNAFLPDPGVIDYSATKAAVWNLSKSLSKEYGPQGIRFNTISPGPVSTPLWLGDGGVAATVAAAMGVTPEEARERIIAEGGGFSTGRFTEPAEVADLVLLLASDRAGNVTGADFLIDGGLTKDL